MTHRLMPSVITTIALISCPPLLAADLSDADAAKIHELRMAGQSQSAVAMLTDHQATADRSPRALALLALAHLDEGDLLAADSVLGPIIKPYLGSEPDVLLAMGLVLSLSQEHRRGLVYLRRAEVAAAGDVSTGWARRLGDVLGNPRLEPLHELLAFDAADMPQSLHDRFTAHAIYQVAVARISAGQADDESVRILRAAIELDPADPGIRITLANIQIERGEFDAARETAQYLADHFEARMEEVQYIRGVLHRREGQLEKALDYLTDAVTLSNREHIPALLAAAELSMQLERYYEARVHLDRIIAIAPGEIKPRQLFARYNLYRAENTDNPGDEALYLREAEKHCLFANVREPYNVETLELLEAAYLRMLERGNKKIDLGALRQNLLIARLKAKSDQRAK